MAERPRILVVDGEERYRRVLLKLLESCGYDVTIRASGAAALRAYLQRVFPLVITDIEIPDMTGIELLQQIKKINMQTEIIVINNYASLDTAIAAMRSGAYDYLVKPLRDREVICNAAHRALEKYRLQKQNFNLIQALKQHNKALESANKRLKKLATHDDLTGLFNHRYFQQRILLEIDRAQRYPESFSILFIDLDDFKCYNDTNGHLEGDRLLKDLSALFLRGFRKTDVVARYGGDEFVVILPETPKNHARRIAAKLHRRVAGYPFANCDRMPGECITISIGLATYPEDGTSADTLMHHADQMLYDGKRKKGDLAVRKGSPAEEAVFYKSSTP